MIDHCGSAEAPDQIAVELCAINWHLTFGIAAQALPAHPLPAAIAIADDVIAIVARVVTGPHP